MICDECQERVWPAIQNEEDKALFICPECGHVIDTIYPTDTQQEGVESHA